MKIAVTYENGQIFQHFGHTQQFKVYEVEDGKIVKTEVVDTNGQGHGALAGFLFGGGVDVLICGGIGAGNVTKLCNQTIVAVNIAALAEALQMGQMCGVEPEKIFEAIKGGLAGSTVMNAKAPMMMDQNFKPGFRIDLHIKDLNNVVDAAKAVDAPIPLTQQVLEMMKILHHDGEGSCDHSALLKYYQKLTGEVLHH